MPWWPSLWSKTGSVGAFEVVCACGHPLRGTRRRQPQAPACPICGRRVFVLGSSPFDRLGPNTKPESSQRPRSRWAWVLPVAVGVVLMAGLVGGFVYFLPQLGRFPVKQAQDTQAEEARAYLESGRQALGEGRFERALKDLNAAAVLRDARPALLSATDSRLLNQLQRQTTVLSRLLSRSLQEIVQEAALTRDEEEWKERFSRDFRGKSVVFDDVIKRDAAGRPVLGMYMLRVGDETIRVALEDLEVLSALPLNPPQRLLFGGQLAAVEREGGGGWVAHFEPASGVLITDGAAAASFYPGKLDDELLGLLQRQAEWAR